MTPPEVIARLKELEAKATPGPLVLDGNVIEGPYQVAKFFMYPHVREECEADRQLFLSLRNAAPSLISDAESLAAAEEIITDLRRKLAIAGVEGSPPPGGGTIPNLVARVRELEEAVRELSDGWRWSKSLPANPIARAAVAQNEAE